MFEYKEDPKHDSYLLKICIEDGIPFLTGGNNNIIMIDPETKKQLQTIPIKVSNTIIIRDEFTCKLIKNSRGAVINITSNITDNFTIDNYTIDEYFANYNKNVMSKDHTLYDICEFAININIDIFDNKYYMVTYDEEDVKSVDIFCLEEMQQIIDDYIIGKETETNIFIVETE